MNPENREGESWCFIMFKGHRAQGSCFIPKWFSTRFNLSYWEVIWFEIKDLQLWRGSGRVGRRCAAVRDSPDRAGSAGSGYRRHPYSDNCPPHPDRAPSPRNLPPPSPELHLAKDWEETEKQQHVLKMLQRHQRRAATLILLRGNGDTRHTSICLYHS